MTWTNPFRDLLRRWLGITPPVPVPRSTDGEFDPENPDNWVGLDYIHDQITDKLNEQSDLWKEADGRLRFVLGVISIVFAVTLGLLPRGTTAVATATGGTSDTQYLSFLVGALAIAGLTIFFGAGFIAVRAFWPRDFDWPPKPGALPKYVTTDPRIIKWTVVTEMVEAYARNNIELEAKILGFRRAMLAVAIATVLLGAAVMIQLALVTRGWGP